ncbi:SRPBCC domain-containing protein [Streptomyces sp. NPDC048057]|uniref:SRPBCC domain-containing protein n=1 Tax=Streptomyces sp. NPDC048057 TaxID=3155628 RepID=UPI0033E49B68
MDHEVFVPVPVETVRQTLGDPARVARCVPGLQRSAADGPLAGRLKVRIGNHSITYRGTLRISEVDGVFAVDAEGTEVRGTGSAAVALTIRTTAAAEGGTTLGFSGTAHGEGRLTELPESATVQAAHRLLDRFAERLAEVAAEPPEPAGGVFDTAVPPSSLGRESDDGFADADADTDDAEGLEGLDDIESLGDFGDVDDVSEEPPAEAAHARRTMIGRSAEEVDHAPPRGRYAPQPAPDAGAPTLPLRWLAPAAALAVVSAVAVSRALRRRK